ncbi:hypothetical protein A2U01_0091445, partial [Trifolium medium]|nr:hypothetical protein [Trifolium medium]
KELNRQHQGQVLEKEEAREELEQASSKNPATSSHKEAVEDKPQEEPQTTPEATIQVLDNNNNNAETVCTDPQGPTAIETA